MVPDSFISFFLAGTGAGAALIGLLFVAISIRPALTAAHGSHPLIQATVASAFTALVNGFFISFAALLPHLNIGGTTLAMGGFGAFTSLASGVMLAHELPHQGGVAGHWSQRVRALILVGASAVVYSFELFEGWRALRAPGDADAVASVATLVLVAFGLGLIRAWELLGARRGGLLSWVSPLRDFDQLVAPPLAPLPLMREADDETPPR
jgi:hypothetical protein